MPQLLTFKDFLNTPNHIDEEFRTTLTALKEAHPVISNIPAVTKYLNGADQTSFSAAQVNSVLRAILQRSVTLARTAATQRPQDQFLTIAEQNVLTSSAVVLSAALAVHLTSSMDRLSKIVSALAENK